MTFDYVYSDAYLEWKLGVGHPTNPVRALNTKRLLDAQDIDYALVKPRMATHAELELAHGKRYIKETIAGINSQWHGRSIPMGRTARLMAGGTMTAVDRILAGETVRAFNPQGAKHHAERDNGGGFCVYNDHAMAARRLTAAGLRVFVLDWDVHQGNGTESILLEDDNVMTASIHGIWFGGLRGTDRSRHAVNIELSSGDGDRQWLDAVDTALDYGTDFEPDIVLLATGADSHRTDSLGNLLVTVDGYSQAAQKVRSFADNWTASRILVGGAGGYQPHTWTPRCWAAVAEQLV